MTLYFYKKRKNNKDSILRMTQYFDTSGNLVERDEYNVKGEVFRITNYTYQNDILFQQESISKEMFSINSSNLSKKLKTYEHDSFGNVITEKEFSYFGDSLKSVSTTIWNREYDSQGHLIKEFITLPGGKTYLHHVYYYSNEILNEIKTYDINQNWMYSYLYEYDELTRIKSLYLNNSSKVLKHEFFYDDQKKLVKEKDYDQGRAFLDHSTQTYIYKSNGLLESQSFDDIKGENYYYKHFYTQ